MYILLRYNYILSSISFFLDPLHPSLKTHIIYCKKKSDTLPPPSFLSQTKPPKNNAFFCCLPNPALKGKQWDTAGGSSQDLLSGYITMVIVFPRPGVIPPSQWPFTSWLIHGDDPNHLEVLGWSSSRTGPTTRWPSTQVQRSWCWRWGNYRQCHSPS